MVSECLDLPASRSMSPGLGGLAESLCRFSLFLRLLTLAEVQGEDKQLLLCLLEKSGKSPQIAQL